MINWHQDVIDDLNNNNYSNVIQFYEDLIEHKPSDHLVYLYLGLAYLLDGKEEIAQMTWIMILDESTEEDHQTWTNNLITILKREFQYQKNQKAFLTCWLILKYLQEFESNSASVIIDLIEINIEMYQLTLSKFYLEDACSLLDIEDIKIDNKRLYDSLKLVLSNPSNQILDFVEACLFRLDSIETAGLTILIETASFLGYYHNLPVFSIQLIDICLRLRPNYLSALEHLPRLFLLTRDYQKAISSAQNFYDQCKTVEHQFFANSLLLKSLLSAGAWSSLTTVSARQKELLKSLLDSHSLDLSLPIIKSLVVFSSLLFYLEDNISENRCFQNRSSQLFLKNIQQNSDAKILSHKKNNPKNDKLKIGYIAHTLKSHSVGWLSRWLFKYHCRDEFDVSIYLLAQDPNDSFFESWFSTHVDQVHSFLDDVPSAIEKIYDDKIDILIDLDSTTLDDTLAVLSQKPAPLQITWLGWDASGLPTIDYFIADPYVLSPEADIHYSEKIWRLPNTYLAVDGFEADVPTLRRSDLNIPLDAVVYLSAQVGMKRHPRIIKMQFDILKEVPNSYFLIKGLSDNSIIQEMFLEFAAKADFNPDRLRFLPLMKTEQIHRANLRLADIVLDTYPYNGATTTLETLWMGIPLVTRVGEQFSARNSYAFMMNVGVTEGIAWTDDEYVEWGIRLGKDEQLRQQVTWKLKQSRQTSPLWNAKQFTRDMENAYREMWAIHTTT